MHVYRVSLHYILLQPQPSHSDYCLVFPSALHLPPPITLCATQLQIFKGRQDMPFASGQVFVGGSSISPMLQTERPRCVRAREPQVVPWEIDARDVFRGKYKKLTLFVGAHVIIGAYLPRRASLYDMIFRGVRGLGRYVLDGLYVAAERPETEGRRVLERGIDQEREPCDDELHILKQRRL